MMPEPLEEFTVSSHNSSIILLLDRTDDRFDLTAPYQRGSVWNDEQRRNLIRSLLLGLPIGSVCVSTLHGRDRDLRVIDGKQRVEAIRAWINGRLSVPLHWFPRRYWGDDLGEVGKYTQVYYHGLNRVGQRHFENGTFSLIEFDCQTKYIRDQDTGKIKERITLTDEETLSVEALVFDLINFGGVPQTEDDRRRAANLHRKENT